MFVCAIVVGFAASSAEARGTVRIQQSDGSVRTYADVQISIAGRSLRVMSADRVGTLIVTKSACSYAGALQRCLPDTITFVKGATSHDIALRTGTAYLNLTAAALPLPLSSTQLQPNEIVMALQTAHGTYVSLDGEIDRKSK